MKKRTMLISSSLVFAMAIAVPATTFAWFYRPTDYSLVLKAGESVAIMDALVYERQFAEGATDYTYEVISSKAELTQVEQASGLIKLTVEDISFDYLNAASSEYVTDVNRYPRIFIEIDAIKEFFDAYLRVNLTDFSLTYGGSAFTTELFEYKYGIYTNGATDSSGTRQVLSNATPTYGDDIDARYVDDNSFVVDGIPMVDGTTFSVIQNASGNEAQLYVEGFADKVTTDSTTPVFSKALVMSFGVNPEWYIEYIKDNPTFLQGLNTFTAEFTFALSISNIEYTGLEVVR